MTKLLDALNHSQTQAVIHKDGPIQVLSVVGSGKTRIVTRRIAYLIKKHGIPPDSILAVTFTKKAANEMIERLGELISSCHLDDLNIGTFHSACFKILRNEVDWYDPPMRRFNIIEGWRQIRVMRDVIEKDIPELIRLIEPLVPPDAED